MYVIIISPTILDAMINVFTMYQDPISHNIFTIFVNALEEATSFCLELSCEAKNCVLT